MSDVKNPSGSATAPPPNPAAFFQAVNAYQRTAAIKAGVELDVFSGIAQDKTTPAELATWSRAAERGVRILCDYLVVIGLLTKSDGRYALTPDSAAFLDRASPAYLGGATEFLLSPQLLSAFESLSGAVRRGGTTLAGQGTVEPDNEVWVRFAHAMAPLMAMPAEALAKMLTGASDGKRPMRVLDIAAGHGLFGLAIARENPHARIVATDWAAVLEVAKSNAKAMGLADRFETIGGSAFEVDFGGPYDVVLLVNFLHHFDAPTCESVLRKVHAALAPAGRAVVLEFIPNEDRVSPPEAAGFALVMLASTPAGDAYTFREYERMLRRAGFGRCEFAPLPPTMQQVVVARRDGAAS